MRRVGAALLAAALLAGGCGGAGPAPAAAPEPPVRTPPGAGALMIGVHARQVVKGRVEVEIFAREAWNSRTADWVEGRQVQVSYFPAGRKSATLAADEARYDFRARRLRATGHVVAVNDDVQLRTSALVYDGMRDKVMTDRPVTIVRGSNVMTGDGLRADPDLGHMEVDNPRIQARNPSEMKPLVDRLAPAAPAR